MTDWKKFPRLSLGEKGPSVGGTLPVHEVVSAVAASDLSGLSLLRSRSDLDVDDIRQALEFAAETMREVSGDQPVEPLAPPPVVKPPAPAPAPAPAPRPVAKPAEEPHPPAVKPAKP
jgi:hypothetical protein